MQTAFNCGGSQIVAGYLLVINKEGKFKLFRKNDQWAIKLLFLKYLISNANLTFDVCKFSIL